MAFGDVYGYRTNVSTVVAFAEGDEYGVDANGDEVAAGAGEYDAVDLVLTGFASGTARRSRVRVGNDTGTGAAEANQAFVPGSVGA